jgi:hypothetical protein
MDAALRGSGAHDMYDFSEAVEDWREHRGVLARSLTNEQWIGVALAARQMTSISGTSRGEVARALGLPGHGVRQGGRTDEEVERSLMLSLHRDLNEATELLAYAAEGKEVGRFYARFRKEQAERNAAQMYERCGISESDRRRTRWAGRMARVLPRRRP